ncbi:TetR/AcrR family transcriptional regulator [Nocardia sp. 004]|uniref:TetR/AcrR family transcriptional regulator n=1 Tax=Nocardia sp. 004 TaxID=3385978 RepID=UPI00399EF323
MTAESTTAEITTTRRGRPRQTPEQAEEVRARIIRATAEVFARTGSHNLSVTQIIKQAGLARPTFYRYFGNAIEPLHAVLDSSNDRLVSGIRTALADSSEPVDLGIRLIDAYLGWAYGHGPMLRPLFAEMHDSGSPVSAYRERALDDIRGLVLEIFTDLDRTLPRPIDLDAALHLCEYVVYRISADKGTGIESDTETVAAARLTMIRVLITLLGSKDDMEYALTMPSIFPTEP